MKKVMFYSKHRLLHHFNSNGQKDRNIMVLFSTVFLCSVLIGSALFFASGESSLLKKLLFVLYENNCAQNLLILFCAIGIVIFLCVTAGLSCAGISILTFVAMICGMISSFFPSYLLYYNGAKGLGYFSLLLLPGLTLCCVSMLMMCMVNAQMSKSLCSNILFDRKEEIDLRIFIFRNGICAGGMLLSVLLLYICDKLFRGLF